MSYKSEPILSRDKEYFLIKDWQSNGNKNSLHKVLKAYKRMSVSYARKFMRYGVSTEDLIQEGIIGTIHAINKFDINKKFRLATYASWWIRASMQEYILKNWSIVRISSTASQKALFFGLRKIKNQIADASNNSFSEDQINYVAKIHNVKNKVVQDMESKLSLGDFSLNNIQNSETNSDYMSNLLDEGPTPEDIVTAMKDNSSRSKWLHQALNNLDKREKEIVKRKLNDKVVTLEVLSKKIGVSKERIRQIEYQAYKKLNKEILSISKQSKDFFIDNN